MKKKTIVMGALGTAALAATAVAGVAGYFYQIVLPRNSKVIKKPEEGVYSDDPDKQEAYEEAKLWLDNIEKEELEIKSFDDLRLHATFIPAESYTTVTVVLVHGFRANWFKDFGLMLKFYHNLGVNILLPDDRGHGKSEGDYIGFGYHDHFDVEKWVDYLIIRFGSKSSVFLHGVSMGAATVMIASGDELPEQVKGIIEDCGYSTLKKQLSHSFKGGKKIPVAPFINIVSAVAKKKAGYKFSDCNSMAALKRATLPYLFIHGDVDDVVPTYMAYENFEACASEDKALVLIEGAGHAENYYVDKSAYEEAVANFINRNMGETE